MKRIKLRAAAMLCICMLSVSLVGCGTEKEEKKASLIGTYTAEVSEDMAYCPTLSLFEDGTYQFNVGMGNYFKGTYQVTDGKIELSLSENASKLSDEDISDVVFTKSDNEEQLLIQNEIKGYVPSNTAFSK